MAFRRIFAAALFFDGSFYIVGTVVALQAVKLGVSSVQLGLLPVVGSGVYVVAALLFGRIAHRTWSYPLARWGALLRALSTLVLLTVDSISGLFLIVALLGGLNAMFWPGIQAVLPRLATGVALTRMAGRFNAAWSFGKMLGFLVGGFLVEKSGYSLPTTLAVFGTVAVVFLLPRPEGLDRRSTAGAVEEEGGSESPVRSTPEVPDSGSVSTWQRIGWSANFVLFGIGASLGFHLAKLLESRGDGGFHFGAFLFSIYLSQTLAFWALSRWRGWVFRLRWILLAESVAALALFVLPLIHGIGAMIALAPVIGAAMGLGYASSLYYTLLGPPGVRSKTGVHEAILAGGGILIPLLGGAGADLVGRDELPYWVAGFALLAVAGIQSFWAARRDRTKIRPEPEPELEPERGRTSGETFFGERP